MKYYYRNNYCLSQNILDNKNIINCVNPMTMCSDNKYEEDEKQKGISLNISKCRYFLFPIVGILYIILLNILTFEGNISTNIQFKNTFKRNLSWKEPSLAEVRQRYERRSIYLGENFMSTAKNLLKRECKNEKSVFNKYSYLFANLFKDDSCYRFEISHYMLSGNSEYTNDLDLEINKQLVLLNNDNNSELRIHTIWHNVMNNEKRKFNSVNTYFNNNYLDLRKKYKTPFNYAKSTCDQCNEFFVVAKKYVENPLNKLFNKWYKNNVYLDANEFKVIVMACRLLWRKKAESLKKDGLLYLKEPFEALHRERKKIHEKGGNALKFKAQEFYEKNTDLVTYKGSRLLNSLKKVNLEVEYDDDDDDEAENEKKKQEKIKDHKKEEEDAYEDNEDYDDYDDYDEELYDKNGEVIVEGANEDQSYEYNYHYEEPYILTPELIEAIERAVERDVEREVERRSEKLIDDKWKRRLVQEIRDKPKKKVRFNS
ncbi:exported protein (PHISTb) [Plasmodium reichenowi]|uniref:Exported protein (PHISTb) n=1 Tax=Plasmodium reichenowi TaxID=5854 RepID=A0A151LUS6_PLARE|nr:exported protein (PHISTb) [Plasmodium reichenowi]KYO02936.1 exported protein (PHISTb) [Plasmodium reichenowi]